MNLGTLVDNRYEIGSGTNVLQASSFDFANPTTRVVRDLQPDIVNFRAFYGRDESVPPDGIIDTFDQATPTDNAGWRNVLAVRVILVARSSTWERDMVTTANPEWSVGSNPSVGGAAPCASGTGECITLDVGAGPAGDVEPKHHRYKVFDTVIPLRNMLWSSQ
jgi:type IV pilus assembly protein PilW